MLEHLHILDILPGDLGDGYVVDVHLVPPDQKQQQIQRAVVDLEGNLVLAQR